MLSKLARVHCTGPGSAQSSSLSSCGSLAETLPHPDGTQQHLLLFPPRSQCPGHPQTLTAFSTCSSHCGSHHHLQVNLTLPFSAHTVTPHGLRQSPVPRFRSQSTPQAPLHPTSAPCALNFTKVSRLCSPPCAPACLWLLSCLSTSRRLD